MGSLRDRVIHFHHVPFQCLFRRALISQGRNRARGTEAHLKPPLLAAIFNCECMHHISFIFPASKHFIGQVEMLVGPIVLAVSS